MGTNYYAVKLESAPCESCGRYDVAERVHIGKSSVGWCFALHVIPEMGIHTLEDWKTFLRQPRIQIEDEYGAPWGLQEMLDRITKRGRNQPGNWTEQDYRANNAEPGPENLARHKIGSHCVGHGDGTWDYIVGEFS